MNILELIPKGMNNAISMHDISVLSGMDEREVRQSIFDARCNGTIICSSVNGYFFPETNTELLAWYRTVKKRGMASLESLKSARKQLLDAGIDPDA